MSHLFHFESIEHLGKFCILCYDLHYLQSGVMGEFRKQSGTKYDKPQPEPYSKR